MGRREAIIETLVHVATCCGCLQQETHACNRETHVVMGACNRETHGVGTCNRETCCMQQGNMLYGTGKHVCNRETHVLGACNRETHGVGACNMMWVHATGKHMVWVHATGKHMVWVHVVGKSVNVIFFFTVVIQQTAQQRNMRWLSDLFN